MIKINLALRKSPAGGSTDKGASLRGALGARVGRFDFRIEGLRELPIKSFVIVLLVYFACDWAFEDYKAGEIAKLDAALSKLSSQLKQIQTEIASERGNQALMAQVDQDEKAMKIKIEVIEKLMVDRQVPPALLKSLSTLVPSELWLTELKIEEQAVQMSGMSLGLSQFTDFVKVLNDSAYFTDVDPKAGNSRDESGLEISTFNLTAKRR